MTPIKLLATIGCMIFAAVAAQPLVAQTLEIAPITVYLTQGRMASTIKLTNRGDQPTTVQVRPYSWVQRDGNDQLDPTGDVLASPPFATIGPGESQTVRVVLRKPATGREDTYRLLVDQLPPAAAPGSVRVALRISLPVFAEASSSAAPQLGWRLVASGDQSVLVVRNDGSRHARISDLKLTSAAGAVMAPGFAFKYVLPGAQIAIPVHITGPVRGPLHVSAASDQGRIDVDAPVSPSP